MRSSVDASATGSEESELSVATYNLYVGADIFRLVQPAPDDPCVVAGLPPQALLPCLAAETFGIVQQTNFTERAGAIAAEIDDQAPDVIGLQEVSLIRIDAPSNFDPANPVPNAETVFADYLEIILSALEARGLDYDVAGVIENADVELPAFVDPTDPTAGLFDVRLTDRDVLLVRSGTQVDDVEAANFATNLTIDVGGLPVPFLRGYVAADVTVDGFTSRVVNTHLEILEPSLTQSAQAFELVQNVADETDPVVLLGDFNSAPEDVANIPAPVPYGILTGAGQFTDVWPTGQGDGFTCCQSETLTNVDSELFQRIDLILVRTNPGYEQAATGVTVLGADAGSKTPSGLWPSDHAGVSATISVTPECVLCVLDPTGVSFSSSGAGTVSVTGGDIVINSSDSEALKVSGDGTVVTDGTLGIFGGFNAGSGALTPLPTFRDPVADPLASLPVPTLAGPSQGKAKVGGSADLTLAPGIYTEIVSSSSGQITLEPGIYVVTKGIKLSKSPDLGKVSLLADGATIYFACEDYPTPCSSGEKGGTLTMSSETTATWSPPDSGPYRGLSVFFDRANNNKLTMSGSGTNAFTGTAYLKSGVLDLSGSSEVSTTMGSKLVVGALKKSGDSVINVSSE